jgi:two-component system, OmpR family, sensor histidine kinase BaeS
MTELERGPDWCQTRRWRGLELRWQLVLLNLGVVASTVVFILVLMHTIGMQQLMHFVESQVYPTIAAAAALAIVLNFVVVTFAVRPLNAVRDATQQLARGDSPAPIETRRRDEIGNVAESVNELSRSLQQLEDLRRQVTNDVAHELRTPLHNLLGLIEGMRDGVIPTSKESLERSRAELGRLITLAEDLRALADAQVARDRIERVPLNLTALVREVMLGFETAMAKRRITYRLTGPAVDPRVDGDARRLAQVLRNIVDNAVTYARSGTCVLVTVTEEDSGVRVSVSDEGLLISDSDLAHIFDRFFRADPSRARGTGGAGIGLAIARELVEAHGGHVGARSEPRGVTIWFEVPSRREHEQLDQTTQATPATRGDRSPQLLSAE